MASPVRLRTVLLAVLVVLAALLVTPGTPANAVDRERVYGAINCPKMSKCPSMNVQWFDKNWTYLGTRKANGGGYALRLAPGTYHLQFIDQRPAYDTSKYAPTDILVTVGQHTVSKSVTMKQGASITGTARAGGKPLGGARVYAANRSEQSFATTANKNGQFAIGGLPAGKYCLFTYDRRKQFVDKCSWVGGLNFGQSKNRKVTLRKKAGNLTVFLETRDGNSAPNSTVTVTSKLTGQWWSAKSRSGKAVFRGLFPGRYRIKYDGGGVWFAATGAVRGGPIRPARMAFGDFTVPKRGGWLTGTVIDGSDPASTLQGAQVLLFDSEGTELAETLSKDDGRFRLDGRIATQSDLTVVVNPNPDQAGLQTGDGYCVFQRTEQIYDYSARAGQGTEIGEVTLDRAPDSKQFSETCETGLN
jgi:hypothetical protein